MQTIKQAHSQQAGTRPPERPFVEVEFVLEDYAAAQVCICGGFHEWRPTRLRMVGNSDVGLWEKRLVLPPGHYEYKFVVDGSWTQDPEAAENVPNILGSLNSVVEVRL
jgi:1,4-alpha-glucan branching enzyme